MIYLDSAATTSVSPIVLQEMLPYLEGQYANPGTIYRFGRAANDAVEKARTRVAEFFGCDAEHVMFTSGGSEANTTVFRGLIEHLLQKGKKRILVSATEHDSVMKAALSMCESGFTVEYIPVTGEGAVNLPVLEGMITEDTGLVSVMYVNNETGAVNPVEEIGALCMKRGVLFHTDCVQAAGAQNIDVGWIGCDFATISAHKIHGAKGCGALFVRDEALLTPLIYGGANQEYGMRGGTENVPAIVAMGKACQLCKENLHEDMIKITTIKQRFYMELLDRLKERGMEHLLHVNGALPVTPGKILNLRFDGVDGETLVLMLDSKGICVSAGSACRSHSVEPSHVLTAMGLTKEEARSSVRVSFSKTNELEEVVSAASIFADLVAVLAQIGAV